MNIFSFSLCAFLFFLPAISAQQPASPPEPSTIAPWAPQADSMKFAGNYAGAEAFLLKTLTAIEQQKGREDLEYASCLHSLADVYKQTGDMQRAETCLLEVKSIRLTKQGRENAGYAGAVFDLGALYHEMWRHDEAEASYREAIAIREKLSGPDSALYATSLYRLSFLYWETGRHRDAEKIVLKVLAIKEKNPGKDNAEYAIYLNQMGNIVSDQGRLEEAEVCYLNSRALREKYLGKEHPHYANTTDNLGILYTDMGRYAEAEKLLEEAKRIREKKPGKMSQPYTRSLNNLAVLYRTTGRLDEAAGCMTQVLTILDSLSGRETPDYANALINLGIIYRDLNHYEQAEQMLLQAYAAWGKIFGSDNPVYAEFAVILGGLYTEMERYEEAEKMYAQGMAILEKIMGKDNLLPAKILRDRARLYEKTGRHELAGPLLAESAEIQKGLLARGVRYLSEKELASYTNVFLLNNYYLFQYTHTRSRSDSPLIPVCYDQTLFNKGFLLNAVSHIKKLSASDTAVAKKYEQLALNTRLLAGEYALPLSERKEAAALEAKVNELEKEIARITGGFGDALRQVSWQEVRQSLKPAEAAIEFVHFRCYDAKNRLTDTVLYAALLIRPEWQAPRWITLFDEKLLNALIQPRKEGKKDRIDEVYGSVNLEMTGSNGYNRTLYQLIWEPLEKELSGVRKVYFSPSGLLHRVNLPAIALNTDSVLADRFQLVQLGSTRQLALQNSTAAAPSFAGATAGKTATATAPATLFGGIRYDMDSTAIRQANANTNYYDALTSNRGYQDFFFADSTLHRSGWDYLPFTDKEVTVIAGNLRRSGIPAQIFRGYDATEEQLKAIGNGHISPRILHIATHGFFFPDPATLSPPAGGEQMGTAFKTSDNPMIRSGLLLAGSNHAWKSGKPLRPGMEDGILTAYEISQMNLSNTELVVLSACETGLGDVQGNEGVYGLQRAFKIAGAKYLIMSLWEVPDRLTSQMMTIFYKKWLEEKMAIPEAFRAAQKKMRETGFAPHQWAGFILVE